MDGKRAQENLDEELSRRLYRALTAGKDELFRVIEDKSMEVLGAALKNPLFHENHLLAMLERRDLSEEIMKAVYRLPIVGESHELKVAIAKNPGTPSHLNLALLPQLRLFEIVAICHLPGVTPDQKMAAERAIIQRLPLTPLGNRLTLARRSTSAVVEALIREGDPRVVEVCLDNPQLKESALFRFLNGPNATAEGISAVARHPRWKNRPNLRLAILKNPRTPPVWFTLFLPHLTIGDIRGVLASKKLGPSQKRLIEEEMVRRGL
jgi:hypothetical protein